MSGTMPIIVAAAGAVVSAGCLLLAVLDRRQGLIESRLRELAPQPALPDTPGRRLLGAPVELAPKPRASAVTKKLTAESDQDRKRHQLRLVQAGIYRANALSTFFIARMACMVGPVLFGFIGGYVGLFDERLGLLAGGIAGTAGMVLPSYWLDRRIARRHAALRRAVPDFLDLMIICLESGLSLQATIHRVGDEMRVGHPLLAEEISIVQRDMELGTSVDQAFAHFAERTGLDIIRTLNSFFREARRFGSELATALRSYADALRYQREQMAEETAQKAAIKILFPTLLLILPAVFVVLAGPAAIKIQEAFSK